jgi:hypothetical protein
MPGERGLLVLRALKAKYDPKGLSSSTTVLKTGTEETAECARTSGVS